MIEMEMIKGRVWKFGDNVSTDLIMPGFVLKTRPALTFEEVTKYVMSSNRPGWAKQVRSGDVIVGGRNFGCGSSRVAAKPLITLGISCVLAESVARIFFRNSISSGFPVLNAPGISSFCQEGDILEIKIETGKIKNLSTQKMMNIEPLPEDSPPMHILKAGGIMRLLEKEYLRK